VGARGKRGARAAQGGPSARVLTLTLNLTLALALALALVLVLAAGCRGGGGAASEPAAPGEPSASTEESGAPTGREIVLFFPSSGGELLHGEKRTVLPIGAPEDRAKQCLEELIKGPNPPLLAAIPDGVRLRQIYLLADGTAFVDFSGEMLAHRGGSLGELQTIYAIVDTLAANVGEIRRVGILVNGRPRETLAGHVDIEQPLPADYQYVDPESRPTKPAEKSEAAGAGATGTAAGAAAGTATGTAAAAGTAAATAAGPGRATEAGEAGKAGATGDSKAGDGDGPAAGGTAGSSGASGGAGGDGRSGASGGAGEGRP
jgi:hypothetical protein